MLFRLVMLRLRNKKLYGQSMLEYVAFLAILIGAFLLFQKYIFRGISGHWKDVGDSMGSGRVYDPSYTTECRFDMWANTGAWINATCFKENCEDDCLFSTKTTTDCAGCVTNCTSQFCND
jgi:hypothetical protein